MNDSEEALRRAILTLWQTSILRRNRLKVIDEVMNGLSYYDYTFFEEIPRLYASLEDQLAAVDPVWNTIELPSFLRMGSWIGGDRDGNPFVTADALHQALLLQSQRALGFYLEQVNLLGGELSLDGNYVAVSEQAQALADSSPDLSPHRQEEPYRRALSGIYARLAATAARMGHAEIARHAVGAAAPYESAGGIVRRSLDHPSLAVVERLGLTRPWTASQTTAGRRRIRIPSCQHRPAAELRRASSACPRTAREGRSGHGLRTACRRTSASPCCWRSCGRRAFWPRPISAIRTRPHPNSPSPARPRTRIGFTARSRFPTT